MIAVSFESYTSIRFQLTCHQGYSSEGLLHSDLCDGAQVEMGVVWHHDAAYKDGHDAYTRNKQTNKHTLSLWD